MASMITNGNGLIGAVGAGTYSSQDCICGIKRFVPIPKNAIPGAAKADRQTEYAVCVGKSDSG